MVGPATLDATRRLTNRFGHAQPRFFRHTVAAAREVPADLQSLRQLSVQDMAKSILTGHGGFTARLNVRPRI